MLGVGGRDLSQAVGGRSTLAAMKLLDEHERTEFVVVLSKPPDPAVAERVRAAAGGMKTPSLVAFVGRGEEDLKPPRHGLSRRLRRKSTRATGVDGSLTTGRPEPVSSVAFSPEGPCATRPWRCRRRRGPIAYDLSSSRTGRSVPICERRVTS